MALNVASTFITNPGVTGNQDIALAANFDPKGLIAIGSPTTTSAPNASISVGFASFRGAAVQHQFACVMAEDNQASADTYQAMNTTSLVRLLSGAGSVSTAVSFVSFTTGVSSSIRVNWTAIGDANASVMLFVFGGSDVLDVEAHEFATVLGTGAQDVALGAGFGHPSIVFLARTPNLNQASSAANATISFGWGVPSGGQAATTFASLDAAATEDCMQRISNNSALYAWHGGAAESDFTIAAEAGFPTDGYEITRATSAFGGEICKGLAIRFSSDVVIATGQNQTPSSSSVLNHAAGGSPRGLFTMYTAQTTQNTTDTSGANCASLGFGTLDKFNSQSYVSTYDDDGQSLASVSDTFFDSVACAALPSIATLGVDPIATGSVTSDGWDLSWFVESALTQLWYAWVSFAVTASTFPAGNRVRRWRY